MAASSGASSPISTSARRAPIGSRWMTRDSTVLPTFAPQPPQRMASVDSSRIAAPSASPAASAGASPPAMAGSSLNFAMNRRSIQSFQRHSHAPSADQLPREATA